MIRTIDQLDDAAGSVWPAVTRLIADAENAVSILPTTRDEGERALMMLQVTTASVLGATCRESGGLLVDRGWIRVLGAGGERMAGSVLSWNGGPGCAVASPLDGAMLVAHDAAGGFFALDGGLFEREPGNILWRSPETLQWEDLETGYAGFIEWCAFGDLGHFHEDLRWPGWEADLAVLAPDEMLITTPAPWERGVPLSERPRRRVRAAEVWAASRPS